LNWALCRVRLVDIVDLHKNWLIIQLATLSCCPVFGGHYNKLGPTPFSVDVGER
jgi:hypothetical protein